MTDAADRHLARQYEAYPYPPRDPREEAKRLVVASPGHVREIDHWIFGAHRPASRPLRALIAGGGTGDSTIMLAQQLSTAGRPGHVTWLDRSAASRRIATSRATARKLDNIDFVEASILDLPTSGIGPFDYIDCCGVLHHMPDPAAGLAALLSVLAPGGGLGLMVYAPHGRTGVYMMQDALRLLAPPDQPPSTRVDIARRALRLMPETAWLKHNPWITDHTNGGDAGLYDLLLNPRDTAFTVPALHALLEAAGLTVTCWVEPVRYDPESYISDPKLRARIAALSPLARAALAEAVAGNMGVHVVYCTRTVEPPPTPAWDDPASVPVLGDDEGEFLARNLPNDGTLPLTFDGARIIVPVPRLAAAILGRIDGTRSIGDIGDAMAANGVSREVFTRDFAALRRAMESTNRLFLAPPSG